MRPLCPGVGACRANSPRSASGGLGHADLFEDLVHSAQGQAVRVGQPAQVVAATAAGVQRGGVEQRAHLQQGERREWYGRPPMSARPSSGVSRPSTALIVVDLPAPFGPTKPVICPGSTVKDSPSTATVLPNRLRRSWTSIVASLMLSEIRDRRASSRHAREPSSAPLTRGTDRLPGPPCGGQTPG